MYRKTLKMVKSQMYVSDLFTFFNVCIFSEIDPEFEAWRVRQEAERERLKKLDYSPPPPERPPKAHHLKPAVSLDSLLGKHNFRHSIFLALLSNLNI